MDKNQIILLLVIVMIIVLIAELAYILLRKSRRNKEMFKRKSEPVETMAEKAHNIILTTESISRSLANQGIITREADSIISQAKRSAASKDYSAAIERAEAAKLVLLRAKREQGERKQAGPERPMDQSVYKTEDVPLTRNQPREEKDLDSLPTNYVQAKFMLGTTRDLLEKKGVSSGEAYEMYQKAKDMFDNQDYSGALSHAIKADRLLDSKSVELIAEERQEEEIIYVCPGCDCEVAEDDVFCRECGHNLEEAGGCPGCGEPIEPTDKFCRKCGQKLE